MNTIKKINPISLATVSAVITMAIMLFVFVPIFLLLGLSGLISENDWGIFGGNIALVFIVPLFYSGISFLVSLVSAFIYNSTFRFHQGIKIEFEEQETISKIGQS